MYEQSSDEELIQQFQQRGDLAAFETLFARHKQAFFNFLRRLSGDASIAEEVSQQVWLKLIEVARLGRYEIKNNASFKTYLFTLGCNRYVDEYLKRHEATRTRSFENLGLEEHVAAELERVACPDFAIDGAQCVTRLNEALANLPFEQRDVIVLWASGMETKIVAKMVGVSLATVLSRKKYAVKKLRAALSAPEETLDEQ